MDSEFQVRTYCPYDLTEFNIPVANQDPEEARRKVIDRPAVCPHGHRFHVEDVFIVSVYPKPKATPLIGYPVLEQLGYLRGVDVVGDKPLPSNPVPHGDPRLVRKVTNGLVTFIFEQELRSQYTDERFFVRMKRDVYRKFLNEAEQIASRRSTRFKGVAVEAADTKSALEYLLDRESPLSVPQLSIMLKLPEQTIYWALHRLIEEDKIVGTPRTRLWGRLYYSRNQIPRDAVIEELASIKEFESKRQLTVEDFKDIIATVDHHEQEIQKQEVMLSWLPNIELAQEKAEQSVPLKPTAAVPRVKNWFTERQKNVVKAGFYTLGTYGGRISKFVDIPTEQLGQLAWKDIPDLDDWKCEEAHFQDMKLVRCVLETLEGRQEKIIALPPLRVGKHGEQLSRNYSLRTAEL